MKKFNFRKLGILLVMMLVAGFVLPASVSAYTGTWTYAQGTGWKVGAYGEYSNYEYGFIYAGSSQSTAGSVDLGYNVIVYNTDAATNPGCTGTGFGTSLSSGLRAYYSDDESVDLHDYGPYTWNNGQVGTGYHSITDYPEH